MTDMKMKDNHDNPFEDAFTTIKGSDIEGVTDEVRDVTSEADGEVTVLYETVTDEVRDASAAADKTFTPMYVTLKGTDESTDKLD